MSDGFVDHFEGTNIDTSKWIVQQNLNTSDYPAYGGTIEVANSTVCLTSNGSSFPYVYSAKNPFPSDGDFALEFDVTFTRIGNAGSGIWVSRGPFVPNQKELGANILQVWADADNGNGIYFLSKQVYKDYVPWNPFGYSNTSTLNIRMQFSNGVYSLYLNGEELASAQSNLRPDTIGFGHPPAFRVPESGSVDWTSFAINSVEVLPPAGISLVSTPSSTTLGIKVDLAGRLADHQNRSIPNANVILSYSVPDSSMWNTLTSALTDTDGNYFATWFPSATGNYLLKVEWKGDEALPERSIAKI